MSVEPVAEARPAAVGRHILEVAYDDPRASALRVLLDDDLGSRYRDANESETPDHRTARQAALALHPDQLVATLIALDAAGEPVGHVILRRLDDEWELKRLLVVAEARGRGYARALVTRVVVEARSRGARRVILQTGMQQPESIALYESLGFTRIPVYEPYAETMPNSLCYALAL